MLHFGLLREGRFKRWDTKGLEKSSTWEILFWCILVTMSQVLSAVSSMLYVSLCHFFFLVNRITTQMPVTPQTCHVFSFTHSSELRPHFTPKYLQFFLNNIPVIRLSLLIHSLISLQTFIILINISIKVLSVYFYKFKFSLLDYFHVCLHCPIYPLYPDFPDSSSHTCPRKDLAHLMHYMNYKEITNQTP